jgi:hypothetical protein
MAAALRISTTSGKEATLDKTTARKGMPTEKAGRLIQYQEYVYRDVSGIRLTSLARTLAAAVLYINFSQILLKLSTVQSCISSERAEQRD